MEIIKNNSFVVIDIETTGFSAQKGAKICEIAAARFEKGQTAARLDALINPGIDIPHFASKIHGIYTPDVQCSPPVKKVLEELKDLIQPKDILIFHNAQFDYNFINYELECCGMEKMYNCFIDTLKLSRKLFKGQSCSLENLCAAFNIQTDRFHRALSDALATWQLFVFLCKKLDDMQINTLQELLLFSDSKRQ